jgi:hypothetical protein
MQATMAQNRHLILITLFLALLFTLFYIYQPIDQTTATSLHKDNSKNADEKIKPSPTKKPYTVCNKVDIGWL